MLRELDETLRQLLVTELPYRNGEVEVTLDQPNRENSSRWKKPAVNLFLYDLRENNILRQHQWERASGGNGNNHLAQLKRTPFRVDCFYMITTWANEPETEHYLMSRVLLTLFRYPVLPVDRLVGGLKQQPFELQTHLAAHDRLTNPAEVWASLDNEMRPSVSYVITLALDPWTEETLPTVHTLTLIHGQAADPSKEQKLVPDPQHLDMKSILGIVWDKTKTGERLAEIPVAIKGSGLITKSDKMGRFKLGPILPGKYTLVAWPLEGKPREKVITVPVQEGNYDMEL